MAGHLESRRHVGAWALLGSALAVLAVLGGVLTWRGISELVASDRRGSGVSGLLIVDAALSIGIGLACLVFVTAFVVRLVRRIRR